MLPVSRHAPPSRPSRFCSAAFSLSLFASRCANNATTAMTPPINPTSPSMLIKLLISRLCKYAEGSLDSLFSFSGQRMPLAGGCKRGVVGDQERRTQHPTIQPVRSHWARRNTCQFHHDPDRRLRLHGVLRRRIFREILEQFWHHNITWALIPEGSRLLR